MKTRTDSTMMIVLLTIFNLVAVANIETFVECGRDFITYLSIWSIDFFRRLIVHLSLFKAA